MSLKSSALVNECTLGFLFPSDFREHIGALPDFSQFHSWPSFHWSSFLSFLHCIGQGSPEELPLAHPPFSSSYYRSLLCFHSWAASHKERHLGIKTWHPNPLKDSAHSSTRGWTLLANYLAYFIRDFRASCQPKSPGNPICLRSTYGRRIPKIGIRPPKISLYTGFPKFMTFLTRV